MTQMDVTIEICGMSGDGTIAAGTILNEALSGAGFSVMAFDSYPAEIRGFGRCVTTTRVGQEEMLGLDAQTHVLISLDDEQSRSRVPHLSRHGVVLFDNRPPSYVQEDRSIAAHVGADVNLLGLPFGDIATQASGSRRGRNMVALGGFSALFGVRPECFREVIQKKFGPKGDQVLSQNLKCFEGGYRRATDLFADKRTNISRFPDMSPDSGKVLVSGNQAIAQGALDAGLKLYFGYPITPATPIMEVLAKVLPEHGGRVVQMEDEISSIGAVLGSFFAGRRAMTATSGPGFALMTELITHGVMAEIPAVIVNAQRGGPATGLPTKTEQSDLHAAVHGGPGDSARIVMAPTNVDECYRMTLRSFQLAERYQIPVVVLTDFFLDNRVENIPAPVASEEDRLDGNIYPDEADRADYQRFRVTESGISPRAVPGMEGFAFTATGLEHSEKGLPDYSPKNHMRMSEKRHRKLNRSLGELPRPEIFFPEDHLEVGVVAWGSTFGSALEAVKKLRGEGRKVGAMKITSLSPLHRDRVRDFMNRCSRVLVPELNYGGQLAQLIGHLHVRDLVRLNQVTGEPFRAEAIAEAVRELL